MNNKIQLLSAALLASITLSSQAFAFSLEEDFSAYVEESPDQQAEDILQARIREMEFRDQLKRLDLGNLSDLEASVVAAARSCKYVSSISTTPPRMKVALTFDDGPSTSLPYVLDVLRKFDVKATFFMVGRVASANQALVQRVKNEGHMIIANHSWSHADFHTLSSAKQYQQVQAAFDVLSGYEKQRYFRFPYGNSTCASIDYAHSLGYKLVGWHIDSCDWAFNKTGSVTSKQAQICEVRPENRSNFRGHVIQQVNARRGGIVLMHDVQPNTIRQLDRLIEELLHEGYSFGTLMDADFQSSLR